jgi:hypothetical protein
MNQGNAEGVSRLNIYVSPHTMSGFQPGPKFNILQPYVRPTSRGQQDVHRYDDASLCLGKHFLKFFNSPESVIAGISAALNRDPSPPCVAHVLSSAHDACGSCASKPNYVGASKH